MASDSPDFFALVIGQSNAANHGDAPPLALEDPRAEAWNGVRFTPLADPMPGGSGEKASVWPRLARRLLDAGAVGGCRFAMCAERAAEIRQWAPGGPMHDRLLGLLIGLRGCGRPVTHVLIHHGERDSSLMTGAEFYKRDFLAMERTIRTNGVVAPIYVCRATLRKERRNAMIAGVQIDLARGEGREEGPNSDLLDGDHRSDGTHFSELGLEAFADAWGRCLYGVEPLA